MTVNRNKIDYNTINLDEIMELVCQRASYNYFVGGWAVVYRDIYNAVYNYFYDDNKMTSPWGKIGELTNFICENLNTKMATSTDAFYIIGDVQILEYYKDLV